MSGAVIRRVEVSPAHDGVAELLVTLEFENGGRSTITLDEMAAGALMKACNAETADGLLGESWDKVKDALSVSWNRFC